MGYRVFETADKQFARQLDAFVSEGVSDIAQCVLVLVVVLGSLCLSVIDQHLYRY